MKKLFIGCGIVLLVLVGAVGFVVYKVYPAFKAMTESIEAGMLVFVELELNYPFDAGEPPYDTLEPARFAEHLELRIDLVEFAQTLKQELKTMEASDGGVIETSITAFRMMQPFLPEVAERFTARRMSLTEFRYYSQLLWAVLRDIDKGIGGEGLDPLLNLYNILRERHDEALRGQEELPRLDELIGAESDFDPATLDMLRVLMGERVERVAQAVELLSLEPMYLSLVAGDESGFSAMVFPEGGGLVTLEIAGNDEDEGDPEDG